MGLKSINGVMLTGAKRPTEISTSKYYAPGGMTPAVIPASQAGWPRFVTPGYPTHGGTITREEYLLWEEETFPTNVINLTAERRARR